MWFHLYEVPRVLKFIEIASGMVVVRPGEDENGELFNEYRVSELQDEKSSGG